MSHTPLEETILEHLSRDGPLGPAALLALTDHCESELHAAVLELRAAGLVSETIVGGERRYRLAGSTDSE